MAKSTATKKKSAKSPAKTPAAFASTGDGINSSKLNPSKFSPTNESKMKPLYANAADGLSQLFIESVKDIYWAEKQLVKALPKMAKSAASGQLSDAILNHLDQTKTHVERLEQVFELLDQKPRARKCDAMEGLTKEGEAVVEDTDQGTPARDAGIIMASQKVEHYEIASYTGLIRLAGKLGLQQIGEILSETLAEEQEADAILAEIADTQIAAGNEEE